jgi:hypothetical protein
MRIFWPHEWGVDGSGHDPETFGALSTQMMSNRFILLRKASRSILRCCAAFVWFPIDISRAVLAKAFSTFSMENTVSGMTNP